MSEKRTIQSIDRSIAILELIAEKGQVNLTDICREVNLKTSTAHGILTTLEQAGYITRFQEKLSYTLGLNSLKLGLSYERNTNMKNQIHRLLTRLVEEVNETAYFELKIGTNNYYYLDTVLSSQPLKVTPDGDKFIILPDCSAVAKAYRGESHEAIYRYSRDLQEVMPGLNCFAVPYKTGNAITGLVALSGPANRFTEEKIEDAYYKYLKVMKELKLESHI